MKKLIIPFFVLLFISCGSRSSRPGAATEQSAASSGNTPTKDDITKCMHKQMDIPGDDFSARHAVEIHDIKIGITEPTNEQDRIDGIPEKSDVTMVKVDFTDRAYYTDKTIVYRREITTKTFKDDFGEWKMLIDDSRDVRKEDEPAQPK